MGSCAHVSVHVEARGQPEVLFFRLTIHLVFYDRFFHWDPGLVDWADWLAGPQGS